MNSSEIPDPAVPTVNSITRRSFMKKTALTAGAITLLGRGTGLAAITIGSDGTIHVSGSPNCPHTVEEQAGAPVFVLINGVEYLKIKWVCVACGRTRTEYLSNMA